MSTSQYIYINCRYQYMYWGLLRYWQYQYVILFSIVLTNMVRWYRFTPYLPLWASLFAFNRSQTAWTWLRKDSRTTNVSNFALFVPECSALKRVFSTSSFLRGVGLVHQARLVLNVAWTRWIDIEFQKQWSKDLTLLNCSVARRSYWATSRADDIDCQCPSEH